MTDLRTNKAMAGAAGAGAGGRSLAMSEPFAVSPSPVWPIFRVACSAGEQTSAPSLPSFDWPPSVPSELKVEC